jgi:hypothetical protein
MIETRPVGRLLNRSSGRSRVRSLCAGAAALVPLAMAGPAVAGIGGVGGVSSFPGFEPPPQVCPTGSPALKPDRIRSILKRRGYYAIRDLRYLKPLRGEWIAPVSVAGRYVATASRGFGIVRWQVTVDACTAQVAVAGGPKTHTH